MSSMDALKPARRYPVISVSLEAAEDALRDQGRPLGFVCQGLEALEVLNKRRHKPVEFTVCAREGPGYDHSHRMTHLIFLFVVAQRGSNKIAVRFWKELNLRWLDQCRMEGSYHPIGDERPLWQLDADGAKESSSQIGAKRMTQHWSG